MREFKRYYNETPPKDNELTQILDIAKTEDCYVELTWFVPYSGWYKVIAHPNSTIEELQERVPKMYGV